MHAAAAEEFVMLTTTVDDRQKAGGICRQLVERRLVACGQVVGPIESSYWWDGKVESSEEWLCLLKTQRSRYDDAEAAIRELHPYDTPQILAFPVVAGCRDYLDWLRNETSPK